MRRRGRCANAARQRLSQQAWEKVTAAQQANEWDMDGHAAKSKELLDEVNRELKMAAEAANKNRKQIPFSKINAQFLLDPAGRFVFGALGSGLVAS